MILVGLTSNWGASALLRKFLYLMHGPEREHPDFPPTVQHDLARLWNNLNPFMSNRRRLS